MLFQIKRILSKEQIRSFYQAGIFLGITTLIETSALFLMYDYIKTTIELINLNDAHYKLSYIGIKNEILLPLFTGFFILIGISLKIFSTYRAASLAQYVRHSISEQLIISTMKRPLSDTEGEGSANLTRMILSESDLAVSTVFQPLINFVAAFFTAMATIALAIIISFDVSVIFLAVIITTYAIFGYFAAKLAKIFGNFRTKSNNKRFKSVRNILHNLRYWKFQNDYQTPLSYYSEPSKNIAKYQTYAYTVNLLPKGAVEVSAFGVAIIFAANYSSLMETGGKGIDLIFALALIGRSIPSMQIISNSISQLNYSSKAIGQIVKLLEIDHADQDIRVFELESNNKIIELNEIIDPRLPKTNTDPLSIKINSPGVYLVCGPSGCGKSSLFDILLGLLKPKSGEVNFVGFGKADISYVPQLAMFSEGPVAHAINITFDDWYNEPAAGHLARYGLANLSPDTFVNDANTNLSGGQLQRLAIVRALLNDKQVILLDEPTAALNAAWVEILMEDLECLVKKGKIVIMITHDESIKERYCNNIVNVGGEQ